MSPDGRWVAAQWNRTGRWDTWWFAADGGARLDRSRTWPEASIDPEWWPDGTVVARTSGLVAFPWRGGPGGELRAAPDVTGTPRLGPGGHRALLAARDDRAPTLATAHTWETLASLDGQYDADFLPDGRLVSVTFDGDLGLWDADGRPAGSIPAAVSGEARAVRHGRPGTALVLVRHPGADLWLLELPE